MSGCGCNAPSKAAWYVSVILGRVVPGGTETEYLDLYTCDAHYSDDVHDLVQPGDGWEVVEATAFPTGSGLTRAA
jgi:hypothetical protein